LGVLAGYGGYGNPPIELDGIGYSAANVQAEILAGPLINLPDSPDRQYEAVIGHFDPERSRKATTTCAKCAIEREVKTYKGVEYYAWGEDFQNHLRTRLVAPAFDELGRGGRLAFFDRYVLRTLSSAGIEQMIDAQAGNGSLGLHPDYIEIARKMDSLEAVGVFISCATQSREFGMAWLDRLDLMPQNSPGVQSLRRVWDPQSSEPLLRPYDVVATGWGVDADGIYMALVLVHKREESARQNVGLLLRRIAEASMSDGTKWSAEFSDVEVRSEGRSLVAKMRVHEAWRFIEEGEPLLLHE
jgi:hypothetical protein